MSKPILLLCTLLTLHIGNPCVAQSSLVKMAGQEGEKLYKEKKYKDAEGKFKLVLRVTRQRNPRAHYFLARIYLEAEALRDTNKAQGHYESAKKYRIKFEGKVEKVAALEKEKMGKDRPAAKEVAALAGKKTGDEVIEGGGIEEAPMVEGREISERESEGNVSEVGKVERVESSREGGTETPGIDLPSPEDEPISSGARNQEAIATANVEEERTAFRAGEEQDGLQDLQARTTTDLREEDEVTEREDIQVAIGAREGSSGQSQGSISVSSGESFREENEQVASDSKGEKILRFEVTSESAAAELDSRLGECLRREKKGLALDFGCKHSLHVFRVGSLMWQRKVDKGLYPEAEQFARDVIQVAPDFWQGYWLMAVTYMKRGGGDIVLAEDWWKRAKRRDFMATKNFYDLDPFILEPKEALRNSLLAGRQLMDAEVEKDWIAAEDALMAVQNINFTTRDNETRRMLGEVYFRIGEIAYHLQDYEVAVQYMKYGMSQGYRPKHAEQLIEEAEEWADYEWPVDPRPLAVHPIQFPEFPRGFGSVRLDLGGRHFVGVHTEIKEGKTQEESAQELDVHTYGVAGGRAYKMVFDIRKQLRKAALQGGSAVLLMGILLML